MPYEISRAYEKGTRSYDGKPGPNYWQNFVDYQIHVNIKPAEKLLEGKGKAIYKNLSPDRLNSIVIRLYADVFKKQNIRNWWVDDRDMDQGVDLTEVKINGKPVELKENRKVRRRGTNMVIQLDESLEAGKELVFETSWKQKIPYSNIRTGVIDSTSFFVAYWYPQISVYDDIFGWDMLDYTLLTEFYNNLANFDVTISCPADYLVWATGTLVNAEKVLPDEIYKRYKQAGTSTEVVHLISPDDLKKGFTAADSNWHFKAGKVSDFAFGLSNHYAWDACTQKVNGRDVLINAAFPVLMADECKSLAQTQQKSMMHMSENVPGIPYPYPCFTTFISSEGGGMEYPMMANNGSSDEGLTIHEMYHTYLPMYVRTNERRWAWMDEGWATYTTAVVEQWYFKKKPGLGKIFAEFKSLDENLGKAADLPMMVSSEFLKNNYGYMSYSLPAFVYTVLHHHLGDELFFKSYKEFISRWAEKSPTPYDFFYTFENVSGQDLAWLWKPWFFEFGYPDLDIQSFHKDKLVIVNKGAKPVPVFIETEYHNGKITEIERGAAIWKDGKKTIEIKIPDYAQVKKIILNKQIPDYNPANNFYPSLKEITAKIPVSEKLFGTYTISQVSAQADIERENGLIYFSVKQFGIKTLVYPVDEKNLISINGLVKMEFNTNEAGDITGFFMDWNGWKTEGKKVK